MFISTEFEFDNEKSLDHELKIIKTETGFIEQKFGYNRSIKFEQIPGKRNPIYYDQQHEPMSFRIKIARIDKDDNPVEWDDDFKINVVRWLFKPDFRDFRSMDNPSIVYKIMFVNENLKYENSLGYGYIELEAFSIFSSAFTPITMNVYDFSELTNPEIFEIWNPTNVVDYYYPELEITLVENETEIGLVNLSDGGRGFEFEALNTTDISGTDYASIDTSTYTNVDVVKTIAFSSLDAGTTGIDGIANVYNKDVELLVEVAQANIDLIASIGKYYYHTDKTVWFIVANGIYADIATARTGLGTSQIGYGEEIISIDNENKIIVTDIPSVYRLGNFNRNWFRLVPGNNRIQVEKKCLLTIKSQFPIAL